MAAGSEGGLQEVSLDAGGMQRAAWRCVRLGRSLGKTYRAGFGTIVATRARARVHLNLRYSRHETVTSPLTKIAIATTYCRRSRVDDSHAAMTAMPSRSLADRWSVARCPAMPDHPTPNKLILACATPCVRGRRSVAKGDGQ